MGVLSILDLISSFLRGCGGKRMSDDDLIGKRCQCILFFCIKIKTKSPFSSAFSVFRPFKEHSARSIRAVACWDLQQETELKTAPFLGKLVHLNSKVRNHVHIHRYHVQLLVGTQGHVQLSFDTAERGFKGPRCEQFHTIHLLQYSAR